MKIIKEIKKRLIGNREAYLYDFINSVKIIITNKIPTMGVNKNCTLFINEKFYSTLSDSELIFCIYHEVMHLLYDHHETKKTNHYLVNIAGDIFINEELKEIGYTLKEGALEKKTFGVPDYIYTAEDIYQWLESNLSAEQKEALEELNSTEIKTNEKLEEAEENPKDVGKKLEKIKKSLEKKKSKSVKIQTCAPIKWDIDLKIEIGRLIKRIQHKNYRRPARYEPEGIIRPNHTTTVTHPKINLYIDRSGSMQDDLSVVISSLKEIKTKLKEYIPTYYVFNTITEKIEEGDLDSITADGGTEFNSVEGNADLHVIITDGHLDMNFINSQKNIIMYQIDNNTISRKK